MKSNKYINFQMTSFNLQFHYKAINYINYPKKVYLNYLQ